MRLRLTLTFRVRVRVRVRMRSRVRESVPKGNNLEGNISSSLGHLDKLQSLCVIGELGWGQDQELGNVRARVRASVRVRVRVRG